MSVRWIVAVLVLCGSLATAVEAQPAASTSAFVDLQNGISLQQAIARALEQEPSLRAARTAVDVSRAQEVQAGLRRNLDVSVEIREQPGGTDNQTMIGVEWPLELFRRSRSVTVAERQTSAIQLSVADRERLLVADVRARFGALLVAVREVTSLEELIAAGRVQLEALRVRVDEGASPPLDRDVLDVELRRLQADSYIQAGTAERAALELKRLLNMAPDEPLRIRATLDALVNGESSPPPPNASREAVNNRADVREAEALIAIAEARIERAQGDSRLDVTLFAGYMRMDTGFSQFGFAATGVPERVRGLTHFITGGASVTVPVFDRKQGDVAGARAERVRALAMHQATQLAALNEIAAARAMDQRTHQAAELYGAGVRPLARQNLTVVTQSYELGRSTVFDVLAEQRRFLEVERAYTQTLRAAFEARTELARALGEMP